MNRLDFYNEMILRENIRKAIRVVRKKRLAEARYVPGRAVGGPQRNPLVKAGGRHEKIPNYRYDPVNGVHVRIDYNPRLDYNDELDKAIAKLKQETSLEEAKLRNIIRAILKEDDSATDAPTMNTGGNALDQMLLNTNTLSELEKAYKTLTTAPEQRQSFRAHIINAVVKALGIERVSGLPNAADGAGEADGEADALGALEEAVRALFEAELSVGDTPEDEVEAAAPMLGQEPEKDEDPLESEREEFAAGVDIDDTEDKTGRNYALDAWNKVEKNVTEAYANLGNEADRKQYYDYLITNLKLYFDQWESQLEGTPEEPTTPEYEQEKDAETDIGGEEEMGMEEPMPEEGGEDELDFGGL